MRIGTNPRAARAVLALLVGLLAGAWVGGGLVWVFNRSKTTASGEVAAVSLAPADEFDLIPADAAGFVHVRAADLWKTDAMEDYRRVVGKAGDDALKALDDGFVPAPSTLDRATMVVMAKPGRKGGPGLVVPPGKAAFPPKGGFGPPVGMAGPGPDPVDVDTVFLLNFNTAFDPAKVREAYLTKANKQIAGEHEMWSETGGPGLAFHGDRTIIVGGEWAVRNLLVQKKTPAGPLAPALKLAAGGNRHVVGAINLKAYRPPTDFTRGLPPEANTLWRADALAAGLVVGRGMKVDLRAVYKDDASAEGAEKELRAGAEAGRKSLGEMKTKLREAVTGKPGEKKPRPPSELPEAVGGLFALGAVGMLDEWLANPPLEREGAELSATVEVNSVAGAYASVAALGAGFMLPAVQKVRDAAGRAQGQNNLKQMGLALHAHHDVTSRLPAAAITNPPNSPRGRPLLSWRVAILPYVEEQALYAQFKQDEPWDSPHNIKLLPLMPKVYASARSPAPPGKTHYQVFTTAETAQVKTMFGRTVGRRIFDVTDGTSNTIMVVEAAEPVEWTRPMDLPFDADDDPPPLGPPGVGGFNALLGDGSVRFFPANTRPEALRIWIGANDGIPNPPN
ncbi:MAG TPA: DUF1559 domain-containing protein [Urbifossiella sp.]|nr:DUF1559 domain-containing protein [Urbifossiella sp.]